MSSPLIQPKLCSPILSCKKTRFSHSLQITAQISRDHEGRSSRIVDANLHLLKVRIEEVRKKERRLVDEQLGWDYAAVERHRIRRKVHQEMAVEFVELIGMAASTLGFTILACTSCLYIISFLLHLHQSH